MQAALHEPRALSALDAMMSRQLVPSSAFPGEGHDDDAMCYLRRRDRDGLSLSILIPHLLLFSRLPNSIILKPRSELDRYFSQSLATDLAYISFIMAAHAGAVSEASNSPRGEAASVEASLDSSPASVPATITPNEKVAMCEVEAEAEAVEVEVSTTTASPKWLLQTYFGLVELESQPVSCPRPKVPQIRDGAFNPFCLFHAVAPAKTPENVVFDPSGESPIFENELITVQPSQDHSGWGIFAKVPIAKHSIVLIEDPLLWFPSQSECCRCLQMMSAKDEDILNTLNSYGHESANAIVNSNAYVLSVS